MENFFEYSSRKLEEFIARENLTEASNNPGLIDSLTANTEFEALLDPSTTAQRAGLLALLRERNRQ